MAAAPAFAAPAPLRALRRAAPAPAARRPPRAPPVLPCAVQQQSRPTVRTPAPVPAPSPAPSSQGAPPKWLLSYLVRNKNAVDAALDACLVPGDAHTAKIVDSMRYSLLAGGKRIRPILAIAAYHLFAPAGPAAPLEPVLPTALAVEMMHTMSLIHDDLPSMDNDDFRRGKPTNHTVYGEDVAILAGDAMLSHAFEVVSRNTVDVDPRRIVDVITLLADSVGPRGLAGGQVMDLESEGQKDVSLETLTWIHTHKTAALLRVSCAGGAIIGGATKEDVANVSEFATKVGLAFQIADDVLDVTQTTETLGKTAGKDEANEKATYPRLLGLQGSKAKAGKLVREAKESLAQYGERAETLLALADFIISRNK